MKPTRREFLEGGLAISVAGALGCSAQNDSWVSLSQHLCQSELLSALFVFDPLADGKKPVYATSKGKLSVPLQLSLKTPLGLIEKKAMSMVLWASKISSPTNQPPGPKHQGRALVTAEPGIRELKLMPEAQQELAGMTAYISSYPEYIGVLPFNQTHLGMAIITPSNLSVLS